MALQCFDRSSRCRHYWRILYGCHFACSSPRICEVISGVSVAEGAAASDSDPEKRQIALTNPAIRLLAVCSV